MVIERALTSGRNYSCTIGAPSSHLTLRHIIPLASLPLRPTAVSLTKTRNLNLIPWRRQDHDPFVSNIDRLFDRATRALADPGRLGAMPSALTSPDFFGLSPWLQGPTSFRLDVDENDKSYVVRADLPGVNKDEVSVTLKDNVLTISGEKKSETKDEKRHLVERSYGRFTRSIILPDDANQEVIHAKLNNGVLELTVDKKPTSPEEVPKQIPVE